MTTLRQQLQQLADRLGTTVNTSPGSGLPRLGRSDSALVQHFRSPVRDDIGIVLCPNDLRGLTEVQQHQDTRAAVQHYNYWSRPSLRQGRARGVNRELQDIQTAFYLVTPSAARPIESATEAHDYAHQLLKNAPTLTPREELAKRVASHDWTYHYSDDSRVVAAGDDNWRRIRELIKQVGASGAKKVWKEAAPKDHPFPGA